MKQQLAILSVLVVIFAACRNNEKNTAGTDHSADSTKSSFVFKLEKVADGLDGPLALENAHDGSGRIFVGEQAGRIMVIRNGQVLKTPFINIRNLLVPMKNEYMDMGLLGFAFHPDFRHNGRFFIHYSRPSKKGFNNTSVLAEYKVSDTNPDVAGTKGKILLEVEQPEANHNGGNIVFDEKGYLYIGFGDGGGQGDKHGTIGNGQDLNQLLGKIIRIDVDHGDPYAIPADNPFTKGRKEIWCYGMRMPWRISFDNATHQLFCGDVGQDKYEEVDIIEKGRNYGWRAMEGFHIYDSALYKKENAYSLPIAEYPHPEGVSITGGYVYRGKEFPAMNGLYIFGDWAFKLFYLQKDDSGKWIKQDCHFNGKKDNTFKFRVNSFGEDENGEIYVVTQDEVGAISPTGVIYKIGLEK
jgi:glucose/arabinose dehydrogenase